jgi:hypothetical protein
LRGKGTYQSLLFSQFPGYPLCFFLTELIFFWKKNAAPGEKAAFLCSLFCRVGQERYLSAPFDGGGQLALVSGAVARYPAGQNLSPLGYKFAQFFWHFIINGIYFVHAECTNSFFAFTVAIPSHGSILLHNLS